MSDMNDLKLQGRLVRDAVLRTTKNNKQVALFTLAVNQTKKNADGTYFDEANYFPCSAFVKSEKFASYLKKGQPLILEGYLKQVTKDLGTDENGKRLFDSRTFICTSKIHLIFTGKKEDNPVKTTETEPENTENFIIENESNAEDVFLGDEMAIF